MLKRDIQGKFALKDDDHRQVRSIRLTDQTWKALGITAECFGMTRADYLTAIVSNDANPCNIQEVSPTHQTKSTVAELAATLPTTAKLETLRNQILLELKLGKQAPGYKAALKALNRLIAALTHATRLESE